MGSTKRPRGTARISHLAEDLPKAALEAAEDQGLLTPKKLPKGTMVDGVDCGGMTDDPKKAGIPVYLQRQNLRELTPEQKAALDETAKKHRPDATVVPFYKPKGMTIEEWNALQSRKRQEADAKKREREAATPKPPKKAPPPAGTFTLRGLAKDEDINPKDARRVARANKDKLKVLEVHGKYVYDKKSRDAVLKIIKDGLAEKKSLASSGVKTPRKKKAKIPPPSETVWASKAKVKRQRGEPPKPVSAKKDARKEARAAVKGRKKIKVEGGAIYVKRRPKPATRRRKK